MDFGIHVEVTGHVFAPGVPSYDSGGWYFAAGRVYGTGPS